MNWHDDEGKHDLEMSKYLYSFDFPDIYKISSEILISKNIGRWWIFIME